MFASHVPRSCVFPRDFGLNGQSVFTYVCPAVLATRCTCLPLEYERIVVRRKVDCFFKNKFCRIKNHSFGFLGVQS
jgi:hypothetical protein